MSNVKIPDGYQTVMPYLVIKNAARFISFTQKVFGAEEKSKHMQDDNTIMHAEVKVAGSTIMFADSTEKFPVQTAGLFIYVEDADAVYQKAIDAGATTVTELSNQNYGRTCGVQDPFGNIWWITSSN